MRQLFRRNGLSISLFGLFLLFQIGLSIAGHRQYNQQQNDLHRPKVTYIEYLWTAGFMEATFENWESEFLQIFGYILLTAILFQKGSAESKKLDEEEEIDRDPRQRQHKEDAPWPVRKGGFILKLYENSLSLAFLLLFLVSFIFHAMSGARLYSQEELAFGREAVGTVAYMGTAQFWFESFQNWQSEFLSIGLMVVFSIFLRQRGSPESKPVDSPNSETGND